MWPCGRLCDACFDREVTCFRDEEEAASFFFASFFAFSAFGLLSFFVFTIIFGLLLLDVCAWFPVLDLLTSPPTNAATAFKADAAGSDLSTAENNGFLLLSFRLLRSRCFMICSGVILQCRFRSRFFCFCSSVSTTGTSGAL
jgi:hypothetical protein